MKNYVDIYLVLYLHFKKFIIIIAFKFFCKPKIKQIFWWSCATVQLYKRKRYDVKIFFLFTRILLIFCLYLHIYLFIINVRFISDFNKKVHARALCYLFVSVQLLFLFNQFYSYTIFCCCCCFRCFNGSSPCHIKCWQKQISRQSGRQTNNQRLPNSP